MGGISALTVLLFISGILLSNHCINGQTTPNTISEKLTQAASTTPGKPTTTCSSNVQADRQICSKYVGLNDLVNLLASPNFDVCGTSLQQYACADLSNVAENTIYKILNCFITNPDAIVSQGAYSLFFNQLSMDTMGSVMKMLNEKVPSSSITPQSGINLIVAVWKKQTLVVDDLTSDLLAPWMQDMLSAFLPAFNNDILNCITSSSVTCDGMEAIVQGLNGQYSSFSNETKDDIGMWITKFINAKSCEKDTLANSINSYYRDFKNNTNFKDFQMAFGNQNWYQAISSLNMNQTIDMLMATRIFTSASPIDVQSRVASVTDSWKAKGYDYTKSFFKELKTALTERGVKMINLTVQMLMLDNFFEFMEPQFEQFQSNDWKSMTESMSYFMPSIGTKQLSVLSINVVKNCPNMRTIVSGIGAVYSEMNDNSISEVTDWISDFLRDESSHCTSGVGDWLVDNYKEFKPNVRVVTIIKINPNYNLRDAIDKLASKQLGQFVVQDSEAHTNVTVVEKVFKVLTNGTSEKTVENLGDFWDGFNAANEQPDSFSYDVKNYMLFETVSKLSTNLVNDAVEEISFWLPRRFRFVISALDTKVLNKISLDLRCGSQKSFVKAVSMAYNDTPDTNKADIVNHIQKYMRNDQQNRPEAERCTTQETSTVSYIQSYFGNYFMKIKYKELTSYYANFNAFEPGVFQLLTSDQLGDMIVEEKVYNSEQKVAQVFSYLQTQRIETVDAVMTRFSKTGNAENIQMDNTAAGQKMLQSYSNIMKNKGTTIEFGQIGKLFETQLSILIKFFTIESLSMFDVKDCDTLSVITGNLNTGFSKMTDSTRTDIANWITSKLKSPSLNGCTKANTNSVQWVNSTMGDFFKHTATSKGD